MPGSSPPASPSPRTSSTSAWPTTPAATRPSPARSSPAACSPRSPTRCSRCSPGSGSGSPPRPATAGSRCSHRSAATSWPCCRTPSGTSRPSPAAPGLLSVYLVVEVPIFIAFVALVVWARRREGRLIGRHLSEYADAGWLSPSEVQMLSTMNGRRSARVWARTSGGRAMLRSMRRFQDSASELALLRARMHHSAADAKAAGDRAGAARGHHRQPPGVPRRVLACRACAPSTSPPTIGPDLIALRRRLHRIPELGLSLPLTQQAVLEALDGLDLEITLGESLSSVVAVLRGRAAAAPTRRRRRRRASGRAAARRHGRAAGHRGPAAGLRLRARGPHARLRARPARRGPRRGGADPARAARRARG